VPLNQERKAPSSASKALGGVTSEEGGRRQTCVGGRGEDIYMPFSGKNAQPDGVLLEQEADSG